MPTPQPTTRYTSLDVLKAVGIAYLILLHQTVWIFTYGDIGGMTFEQAGRVGGGLHHILPLHVLGFEIPLLAGAAFYFSIKQKSLPLTSVINRAAGIIFLGFVMNFFAWGPGDTLDWDVLQFIGLSTLIAYPLLKLPTKPGSFMIVLLAVSALAVSQYFPFPAYHGNYFYQIIFGNKGIGFYWPLFPWVAIFLAGTLIGQCLAAKNFKTLLIAGAALVAASIMSGYYFPIYDINNVWGPALFKPSPFFVVGIIGSSCILIPGLEWGVRAFPAAQKFFQQNFFRYYSHGIMWIYILTIIIGYNLTMAVRFEIDLSLAQSTVLLIILALLQWLMAYYIGRFVYKRKIHEN